MKTFFKRNGLLLNWKELEKLDKTQKINTLSSNVFYTAGNHSLVWNGKNELGDIMSTGVYFLRIEAISNNEKKLVLLIGK